MLPLVIVPGIFASQVFPVVLDILIGALYPRERSVVKYTLALAKELLGIVRSKYGTIPIPNSEVSLDGDTLRAEATAEKEQLIEQLRENLEQTSRKALMEAQRDESESQQETLRKVPYPVYIG